MEGVILYFFLCKNVLSQKERKKYFLLQEFGRPDYNGTGTWADYLVNRVTKKLRGTPGKTIAQKSRNSCWVIGRDCGYIETVDSKSKCAQSYK